MKVNPFITSGYISKKYFCDRKKEIASLQTYMRNGVNTTLVSPRRMGKTGLIHRAFEDLKDFGCVYVDIMPTRSIEDFNRLLSEAIFHKFPEKTSIGKKFWEFLRGFRPLISYDSITGQPQIEISYQMESQKPQTLKSILQFLNAQDKKIIVAIDEFQQITTYPEKNMEAILRSEIQTLNNINFIFCGSKRSVMYDMFSNAKRPFYQSTSFLSLEKIDRKEYAKFIVKQFNKSNITISKVCVDFILDWTKNYTFYTQYICNKLFSYSEKEITLKMVTHACRETLAEQATTFNQLRQLLTTAQWNYLIAIAKEGKITQPTAQNFLMKYKIGTPSNSKRLLKTLCEKDIILEQISLKETTYEIYDMFLYHWLLDNYDVI
ncbi:ATPase [Bacteroidia bacterium]|nr:ATPase [Bacteroidia bacterium]